LSQRPVYRWPRLLRASSGLTGYARVDHMPPGTLVEITSCDTNAESEEIVVDGVLADCGAV
jgi:hypothetical protein